jgi:Protein of unknown function (DUF2726)
MHVGAGTKKPALSLLDFLGLDIGGRPRYRRGRFLSEAEKRFLAVLDEAAGPGLRVFAQVRIAELLDPAARAAARRQKALSRIFGKSINFVICAARTFEPVAAIELDDQTHLRAERKARDRFVEEAFASAGLPLVRVPVRHIYPAPAVRKMLFEAIGAARGKPLTEKRGRA